MHDAELARRAELAVANINKHKINYYVQQRCRCGNGKIFRTNANGPGGGSEIECPNCEGQRRTWSAGALGNSNQRTDHDVVNEWLAVAKDYQTK